MGATKRLQKIKALCDEVVAISNLINVLSSLNWDPAICNSYLLARANGKPFLPEVTYQLPDLRGERARLRELLQSVDRGDPLSPIIVSTIESYLIAIDLIGAAGTQEFLELSRSLYGDPRTLVGKGRLDSLEASSHFLDTTKELSKAAELPPDSVCILAETVASRLRAAADKFFGEGIVEVVVDDTLSAKAAASSRRIRLRGSTCFSELDIPQLMQHELFTHSLTKLNGEAQPWLTVLAAGSPRTTCAQEGLALFSELITNVMDLNRLRRISARVEAIQMGIEGANFHDVFELFLECGQTEAESFHSARRVFRGGIVSGGSVFTKDSVYLRGFLEVHEFFLHEIRVGRASSPELLFIGRLAVEDVEIIRSAYEEGIVAKPVYEPHWFRKREALLAFLAYSSFVSDLGLGQPLDAVE